MAIVQRTALGQVVRRRAWGVGVRFPERFGRADGLGRCQFFAGSGGGYRSYRREGYPEHELHQIVSGRKDRFDGLM
jgi:hypothetical protein